uniref:Uncharacterized protein n=1 Tax=Brassica oleracea TaxID=3712 RepID=A0A3P6EZK7_BRAOL|nr:unnamed protein product [Brassica oleracea]
MTSLLYTVQDRREREKYRDRLILVGKIERVGRKADRGLSYWPRASVLMMRIRQQGLSEAVIGCMVLGCDFGGTGSGALRMASVLSVLDGWLETKPSLLVYLGHVGMAGKHEDSNEGAYGWIIRQQSTEAVRTSLGRGKQTEDEPAVRETGSGPFTMPLVIIIIASGQDGRDRFSGALGAYARRNGSGSGAVQADRSRPRTSENVLASSKDTAPVTDFTENRSSRIVPNNGHSSTAQLTQLVPDPTARPSSSSSFA